MEMIYPLTQILKEWVDEENMDTLDKQKEKAKVEEELEIQRERDVCLYDSQFFLI